MATLGEQETIVSGGPREKWNIWSNVRRDVNRLKKKSQVDNNGLIEIVGSGFDSEGTEWIELRVDRDSYSPITGFKRKRTELSPERRKELSEQLQKAREIYNS